MRRVVPLMLFLLLLHHAFAQVQTLSGTVTAEGSKPVGGATVHLLNTGRTAVTNTEGTFLLPGTFPGRYVLLITAIGYADTYKEAVVGKAAENAISITMEKVYKRLDRVIVSAQKTEEQLQGIPIGITALNARKVEEYRLWNTRELTAVVPGLYSADPGDKRNVTSLRGIVSTSYDPAVATYIDGVNQFGLDTYIPQLFDVERIEVLRGPQGTLYGRNAMGGVINIITKKPGNKTEGFAQAGMGNYGQQRYTAGVRVPVKKDKLFFGAAGLYERMSGFYTNEFNGVRYDRQHSLLGNYYLRFVPGATWSMTFNAKHSHNRNRGPFPLVLGAGQALAQPYRLSQNALTKMVDNIFNTSLSLHHTAKAFQLSSHSSYQYNYRYYTDPIDADFSSFDALTLINNYGRDRNRSEVVTQELSLRSPAFRSSALKWSSGVYFFHQRSPVKQASHFGEDAGLMGAPDKNFSLLHTTKSKGLGGAVYGEITYLPAKRLQLAAGLRYDRERREQRVLGEYANDPGAAPLFAYRPDTSAEASFSAFSPRASIAFLPAENHTFYITCSRGFRAGGLTPLSSDPTQPALYPFRPEHSNNLEAGSKSTLWNNRLVINTAVFYTLLTDAQLPALVLPEAFTITRNTGKLNSMGVELELRAIPVRGLAVDYSFGSTRARYGDVKVASNGSEASLKGKNQVFTPELTSLLAAQYMYAFGSRPGMSLVLRGEWKYLGRQYFDLANTTSQPPYSLWNATVGFSVKNAGLNAWINNGSNKTYISYGYDFGAVRLGSPRTFGATMHLKF